VKRLALAILGLLILPAWSVAGPGKDNSSVSGTVQDSTGKFVVGALVSMATNGPSGVDRMVFTDSRGSFGFDNLVPGDYSLQVTMPRFAASQKEKIHLIPGATASVKFTLQSITEVLHRASSPDVKQAQDIVWTLRTSRGTQPVLRFSDSDSTPIFAALSPDYSGYIQFYSKADTGAPTAANSKGSRFSVTVGLPGSAKVTLTGQYNESPLEPKGVGALYEFKPIDGHEAQFAINVRQGLILDDAFSAEELKEFQTSYTDKFYLGKTFVAEQGAEIGHAEGLASNNYLRPKGSLSWVPNDSTVFKVAVSTQAPSQADDPVRSREYFEQVNLPPSHEHYLHSEVSAARFLDDSTKVSMALFQDRTNYRALFVTAPDGRHGLLIFDGKSTPSQGIRLNLNREFNGFEAGIGYTVATAPSLTSTVSNLDDIRSQISRQRFQVVTARIKTDLELTNTELTAVYRWMSKYAAGLIDPYQQTFEYNDPTLSISIAQTLPTFGALPTAKVQAIFDARNLFEQPFGSSRNQLAISPRYVKGGINIRF
jgi:Carboxypeptidase regulatory-like domain